MNIIAPMLVVLALLASCGVNSQPTPDQRYGCTVKQQAPNGECK